MVEGHQGLVEGAEALVAEEGAVGEGPLTAGVVVAPVVALAGEIDPLGMAGKSKKLQDIFVDAKIPKRDRDVWPVWKPGHVV